MSSPTQSFTSVTVVKPWQVHGLSRRVERRRNEPSKWESRSPKRAKFNSNFGIRHADYSTLRLIAHKDPTLSDPNNLKYTRQFFQIACESGDCGLVSKITEMFPSEASLGQVAPGPKIYAVSVDAEELAKELRRYSNSRETSYDPWLNDDKIDSLVASSHFSH